MLSLDSLVDALDAGIVQSGCLLGHQIDRVVEHQVHLQQLFQTEVNAETLLSLRQVKKN